MAPKTYPSTWYRVEQRGCTPNAIGCLHLDWPLERQDLSPTRTDTRHVVPKAVLRYCLGSQLFEHETFRRAGGRPGWRAIGRRTKRGKMVAVSGRTEREAMQNLCAEMKVRLP